jgi:hypothetical protein
MLGELVRRHAHQQRTADAQGGLAHGVPRKSMNKPLAEYGRAEICRCSPVGR